MWYALTTVETGRNLSEISKRSSQNMIQDNTHCNSWLTSLNIFFNTYFYSCHKWHTQYIKANIQKKNVQACMWLICICKC